MEDVFSRVGLIAKMIEKTRGRAIILKVKIGWRIPPHG